LVDEIKPMGQNNNIMEQRKNSRFLTTARATIKELGKEEFQLKDLSITGCRIEYPSDIEISLNTRFSLRIIPEKEAKINPFLITAESKWVGVSGNLYEAGFMITESPKGKQFQNYVDYLSWRYSHGKSMISEDISEPPSIT
jgi:hypothetical protein